MKQLLNSIMLFLLLFVGQNAWSAVVASGDLTSTITWKVEKLSGVTKLTVSGTGEMPDYTSFTAVPWADLRNTISILEIGDGITNLGNYAFNGIAITKVAIPSSCKKIGMYAFYGCKKMTDIYIPASVVTIGTSAVSNCSKLKFVHYDDRCSSRTALNLSSCAKTGRFIEKSGTGDSYANVPEGWEYYTHGVQCYGGAWVAENTDQTKLFFYAQNPGATVNFAVEGRVPSSTRRLDPEYHPWRANCSKYTSLEIDKNIASIDDYEFLGYEDSDVTKMGYTNMQTITVSNNNSYFVVGEDGALYDKSKTTVYLYPAKSTATNIEIPATVTTIRPGAFYGAKNLQKIDFLGTISLINTYAFAQTSSLNCLSFATETAPATTVSTAFTGVARGGVVAASVETDAFKIFTSQIGSGWTFAGETSGPVKSYISDGTLYVVGSGEYTTSSTYASWYDQRSSIKKIVVKEGITNIGSYAFENCSNVTEVTLNNKGSIGEYAFERCEALTRVNIGTGVTEFKSLSDSYEASVVARSTPFYYCSNLSTVNIADLASFLKITNLKYLTNSYYGTAREKTLMVNGVTHSSSGELVIPEGVTSIPNAAFRYFKNVTKIRIPSTMTKIADENFKDHTYLTEVTLNNTGSIGRWAFSNCTALTTVTLNNKGSIGEYAFEKCEALTRVNIGKGVTEFKSLSDSYEASVVARSTPFYDCSELSEVNVADLASFLKITNLKYLTNSYYGTAKEKTLMVNDEEHDSSSELVIPEGVTEIDKYAFKYFKNVTKIKLPSTVTIIRDDNFEYHTYLTEITVPSTVSYVGAGAFDGCTALKTAILNNDGNIGGEAFYDCTSLQTVTLNNNGSIGESAFKNCKALTRVNIGKGVTEFKSLPDKYGEPVVARSYPFYGCSNLSVVNVADIASFLKITNLKYLTYSSYGGTASEKTLMLNGTIPNSLSELVIPEGITEIDEYAFPEFKNVAKIKLPSTMTEIASHNFYGHSYLKKIILPSSVTYVGYAAFGYCTNLERIICEATTPPVTASSIASNPSKISLKVPTGKTSAYKAADVWKEFSIDEGRTFNYSVTMLANESKQITNDLFNYLVVLKNTTTNSSIASPTYTSKTLTIKAGDVSTYYGTTTNSCKSAVIKLYLEDDDVLEYNVTVAPREVVLTDGDAYKNAQDFFTNKISYTRTYAEKYANHLQCFYVPFDVKVTDELLEDFTFYELYMVSQKDENGNGEIEEDEPLVMVLTKIPSGDVMQANMPYYIKPKTESTLTVTAENAKLYAATNGSVSCSTTKNEYTLIGINEPTNIKGYYTMSAKGNFSYYTKDTNLGSYRWYMSVSNRRGSGAELENYARPIQIVIDGEEETTGIVALQDKASDPKNDKIYTLDGRQVTGYDTLPSGIYIINGKKVFKK